MDPREALTARPGQTQEERFPEGLGARFVELDARKADELYEFAARLAPRIRFHYAEGGALKDDADWARFFQGHLPRGCDGETAPHLALLRAFLALRRVPRCAMNGVTARHLAFFYERVLGFAQRPAHPDRAHLVIELKRNAEKVALTAAHAFSAGKDASGTELVYSPLARTVINHAKVKELRSVFVDPASGGTVHFAPVANSGDGLGPAFKEGEKWRGFGHRGMPRAPVGFAFAAPVLRMKEGTRKVRLELELDGLFEGAAAAFRSRLQAFVSGEKRWLGPYFPDATVLGRTLQLEFTIAADDEAVVDYDPAKHEHAFAARAPVVQVLLRDDVVHGYRELQRLIVRTGRIRVEVSGVKALQLESDAGPLDPRRALQPFGPQPVPGARFMVGYAEALEKKLDELVIELQWLGLPDFGGQYGNKNFTARVAARDGGGRETASGEEHGLFQPRGAERVRLTLKPGGAAGAGAPQLPLSVQRFPVLARGGSSWLREEAIRERRRLPVIGSLTPPAPRPGFITLKLVGDFGHTTYRANLLSGTRPNPEPYTPTLSDISLSYQASSEPASLTGEGQFAAAEIEFFHVGCFGQRREHGWLREQFPFVEESRVPLLPEYDDEGELLIGLAGIGSGDSASLLVKVAEGSADPDVDPQPAARWAVLCNNYWRPLAGRDAVHDGTNNFLATGIVNVALPREATVDNSLMPAGFVWLKASVREHVSGVCDLVSVAANAIEVERRSGGTAETRLWTPLPMGKITRLKTPVAQVKTVLQPFATYGGEAKESRAAFNTRVAERLRHRNRFITAWDYERSVLAAFPEIRKAKCIPHCAATGEWLDPGHVTIAVVPDLRQRNAIDRLQPRADADTLSRIRRHLEQRAPMRAGLHVRNPRYQPVRLQFKVRFRRGFEFNFHARTLREELINYLSPWAHEPGSAIRFGGTIYKSQLLDFVEERGYVDYVIDFRMYDLRGGTGDTDDVHEARAATPDAILVSAPDHVIDPVPDAT
jgi:hypothetical protein